VYTFRHREKQNEKEERPENEITKPGNRIHSIYCEIIEGSFIKTDLQM
jgi:hypothetical protein